jgi:hypothetical protein
MGEACKPSKKQSSFGNRGALDRKELPFSSFPIRGKRGLLFLEPSNQTQYGNGGVIFVDTNIYCNKFFTGIDYNMYHLPQF